MGADAEVMRFLGGVVDRAQAWRMMALFAGHWPLRGYGSWVVERRSDQAVLGRAGLWQPEAWRGLEVGWVFGRSAWGYGFATEAAQAAVLWAWEHVDCDQPISLNRPRQRGVAYAKGLREGIVARPEEGDELSDHERDRNREACRTDQQHGHVCSELIVWIPGRYEAWVLGRVGHVDLVVRVGGVGRTRIRAGVIACVDRPRKTRTRTSRLQRLLTSATRRPKRVVRR